jgi:Pro-kumamolisin, activation domain/Divergent InlB B-repeat domain
MKNKIYRGFPVAAAVVLLLCSTGLIQAAGVKAFKTLPARVLQTVARLHLQPVGDLPETNRLQLAIGLPLRNPEALTNLLQQLYDPASPDYHHFLTPQQFTEMFGPSEQDYQAVLAFAKSNGLTVSRTYANRMILDINASVADINQAFHVHVRLYQHPTESRKFYAPDVAPSVPAGLPIQDISGLNNYALPQPMMKFTPLNQTKNNAKPGNGSGPYGLYLGNDFRNAYVPGISLTGAGQSVGLLEFDGFYPNDISNYVSLAGLPAVPLQVVPVDGGVNTPGGGNLEVALDIDMANAMAPGLSKIVVFEAPNPSPWVDILNAMAADTSIKQFSSSWGGGEANPAAEQIFLEMAAQGQSFFNAVGDSDAFVNTIPFPSDSPNITEVGGTTLTMNGTGGSYGSETVWNWGVEYPDEGYDGVGSSGGVSPTYSIPSWQQGINMSANQGSTTMRDTPDVAMTADNIFIFADNGTEGSVGGTSAAAPLWAAFTALVNQKAVGVGHPTLGFLNPALYTIGKGQDYTADFHDIITGNNTWSESPGKYFAVPGYDLCTGWGTPNGANLINDLIGKRTGILQTVVNPPSGSALLQAATQPITVTVIDGYGVTNATVTAVVTNNLGSVVANLTFTNASGQADYNASLSVPSAANPLTMIVTATAPNEAGNTNAVNYLVIGPPPNDNFIDATKIPAGGGSYLENNTYATIETNEPAEDGDQNRAASLWWSWTPTASTNVFIDTIGSKVENVLAVYTGAVLAKSMPQVAATNSSLTLYKPAQLSFNAQGGVTYRIAVASESSNSLGTVALNVVPGGQPDTNAPVVFISSPQSGLTVFNGVIGVDGTAFDPGVNASGVSQVFVTVNGTQFTAVGTTNWTVLAPVHPGLNIIEASAVDEAGNISPTTTAQVNYLIQPPANDYFVNAIPLTGDAGTVVATNTLASKEVGEPNPAGNPGGKSLWWSFTPPQDGVLTLNTTNSTFDTIMGLYTGTNVANLTTIADNDDAYSGAPGGFSFISQAVRSGQIYYILVDGYDGASGAISLSYSFAAANVYHLTVNTSGDGTVQLSVTNALGGVSILPSASADFASGTIVALTAFPGHSDQFDMWDGDEGSSIANPFAFAVNSDLNVTGNFVARQFTDGFESGDLLHLPWITPDPNLTNDFEWIVQTNVVDVGQYAARSGVITNSQSSSLILSNNFVAGTGSFDFKVSSEPAFDILSFSVDGVVLAQWSGEIGWANYSFPLTAGWHKLEWTYSKDATISMGLDAAFLDDVELPIAVAPSSATPAQIQLQQQTGGGLFMNLSGQSGQQYVVQVSTDLVHWQNVSTNIAYGGFIRIPLPSDGTNQAQFYRAVAP